MGPILGLELRNPLSVDGGRKKIWEIAYLGFEEKGCASPLSAVERHLWGGLTEAVQGSPQPEELLWGLIHILEESLKTRSICPKIKFVPKKLEFLVSLFSS